MVNRINDWLDENQINLPVHRGWIFYGSLFLGTHQGINYQTPDKIKKGLNIYFKDDKNTIVENIYMTIGNRIWKQRLKTLIDMSKVNRQLFIELCTFKSLALEELEAVKKRDEYTTYVYEPDPEVEDFVGKYFDSCAQNISEEARNEGLKALRKSLLLPPK